MKCNIKPVDLTLRAFRKYRTALKKENGLNALSTPAAPSKSLKSRVMLANAYELLGHDKNEVRDYDYDRSELIHLIYAGDAVRQLVQYEEFTPFRVMFKSATPIVATGAPFMTTYEIERSVSGGFKDKSKPWEKRGLVAPKEYLQCDPVMPDISVKGAEGSYAIRKLTEALTRLLSVGANKWRKNATQIDRGNLVLSARTIVLNYMYMRAYMRDGQEQVTRAVAPLAALYYYNYEECSPHEVARCIVTAINYGLIHLQDPEAQLNGVSWPRLILGSEFKTPTLILKKNGANIDYSYNPFESMIFSLSIKEHVNNEAVKPKNHVLRSCPHAPNVLLKIK